MRENKFQASLIQELKSRYEGCIVMKQDSGYVQGIPDILVLFRDKWAMLEVKRNKTASHRPNQDYWVDKANGMSFAKFIFPENKEEVLDELDKVFLA